MSQTITIIRKKSKRAKPVLIKSGTWKVAYADFITAMMAFFMLLWLLSVTPENTLRGVAKYFTQSNAASDRIGLGFDGGADANLEEGTNAPNAASSSLIYGSPSRGRRIEQAAQSGMMTNLDKEHFIEVMNNIQKNVELSSFSDNINVDVTNEGLRIQIMDSDNRPMFKPNTHELQPYMNKILTVVGKLLRNQPNYISISGHTASIKNASQDNDYWGMSSLRANEVRKFLVTNNLLNNKQVVRIVGKADTEPFDIENIYGPKNIRVSITLLNNSSVSKFQQAAPEKIFKD